MNKNIAIALIAVVILVGVGGFFMTRKPAEKKAPAVVKEETLDVTLPEVDKAVTAVITPHASKANTLVLTVKGLASKYQTVAYEISYESAGTVQGVTTKPLDVTGKDEFVRDDIYLGTCSKNVCRAHPGVKKVSVVLEFKDAEGKKSQLSKDFDL